MGNGSFKPSKFFDLLEWVLHPNEENQSESGIHKDVTCAKHCDVVGVKVQTLLSCIIHKTDDNRVNNCYDVARLGHRSEKCAAHGGSTEVEFAKKHRYECEHD